MTEIYPIKVWSLTSGHPVVSIHLRFRESENTESVVNLHILFDLLLDHLPLPEGARALQGRQLLVEDPVQHRDIDRTLRVVPRGFRLAALEQLRNLDGVQ